MFSMKDVESIQQFESRKADHIRVAMEPGVQSLGSGFDSISFVPEALPEIDFDEVSIAGQIFPETDRAASLASPFFISSMTAGHDSSMMLNERLAACAASEGWAMGVGSQRRELFDPAAALEWRRIRTKYPTVTLFGNIGLSQLIHTDVAVIRRLVEALDATAFIVHLNALQEVLQIEGTPRFRGGLKAIENLVRELDCPVVVKETGCGISGPTAHRLFEVGVRAIDVAGRGGTHWGRIEGVRAASNPAGAVKSLAAESLGNWGLSTVESLRQVLEVRDSSRPKSNGSAASRPEVWASGGVRTGLDGAKALVLGASLVGVAQPLMAAALKGEDELRQTMNRFDFELKTVLFCQGARNLTEFRDRAQWAYLGKGGGL